MGSVIPGEDCMILRLATVHESAGSAGILPAVAGHRAVDDVAGRMPALPFPWQRESRSARRSPCAQTRARFSASLTRRLAQTPLCGVCDLRKDRLPAIRGLISSCGRYVAHSDSELCSRLRQVASRTRRPQRARSAAAGQGSDRRRRAPDSEPGNTSAMVGCRPELIRTTNHACDQRG
jgi:hypothetical protein